jgi:hypothetical protein
VESQVAKKKPEEKQPQRSFMDGPTPEELRTLVMWPEGCRGYFDEVTLVTVLNELMKTHGFGRVPQLASQIRELWDNPEKAKEFEKMRQEHLELMGQMSAKVNSKD